MGTVALMLLLAWLVITAIMTIASGRLAAQHDTGAMRRLERNHPSSPPASAQDTSENGR